jgi:hypothetical protein
VSLSWRDRVFVSLEPRAVHAVRGSEKRQAEELKDVLAGWERADVTIVVSNRLVRYVVVPRTKEVSGEDEELALARHHFARVHGERARDWHVRISPETGLASALALSLVNELKAFFERKKSLRLVSLQPYLMAAFNRWRARVPREGAWIVLPEPEATCVALFERGSWSGVSVSRADPDQAVARERLRMGGKNAPRMVLTPPENDGFAMAMSAA